MTDERRFIPVEGNPDLMRDASTGAIVAVRHDKYLQAKKRKESIRKQQHVEQTTMNLARQVELLSQRVEVLEQKIADMQKGPNKSKKG